jgi:prepilin-type processing-associated H-X9-DG protein
VSQLVHGDLSGNVLFADGLPPAVIDWSPYWRPPPYASAIVMCDAALGHGAGVELLAGSDRQLLIRALLFRLLSEPAAAASCAPVLEYALG